MFGVFSWSILFHFTFKLWDDIEKIKHVKSQAYITISMKKTITITISVKYLWPCMFSTKYTTCDITLCIKKCTKLNWLLRREPAFQLVLTSKNLARDFSISQQINLHKGLNKENKIFCAQKIYVKEISCKYHYRQNNCSWFHLFKDYQFSYKLHQRYHRPRLWHQSAKREMRISFTVTGKWPNRWLNRYRKPISEINADISYSM